MKKLLEVHDICEIATKGILVGGVNKEFDRLTKAEVINNIGNTIDFVNPNGSKITSKVLDIDFSTSLTGNKNFFILLPFEVRDLIQIGANAFENNS
jgi:hypothetical protein